MIIGITGNSGVGKTEFSKILAKKLEAEIIDADSIVKKMSNKGNEYYNKIVELFGTGILKNDTLNRKKIAEIIFSNEAKRKSLNKLTYKYVVEEIKKEVSQSNKKNIIIDAPLLFESKLDKICNYTIAIVAEKNEKIQRICKRDNIDENIANLRIKAQPEDEFYKKHANYIIENNHSIDEINWEEICTKIGKN